MTEITQHHDEHGCGECLEWEEQFTDTRTDAEKAYAETAYAETAGYKAALEGRD